MWACDQSSSLLQHQRVCVFGGLAKKHCNHWMQEGGGLRGHILGAENLNQGSQMPRCARNTRVSLLPLSALLVLISSSAPMVILFVLMIRYPYTCRIHSVGKEHCCMGCIANIVRSG